MSEEMLGVVVDLSETSVTISIFGLVDVLLMLTRTPALQQVVRLTGWILVVVVAMILVLKVVDDQESMEAEC